MTDIPLKRKNTSQDRFTKSNAVAWSVQPLIGGFMAILVAGVFASVARALSNLMPPHWFDNERYTAFWMVGISLWIISVAAWGQATALPKSLAHYRLRWGIYTSLTAIWLVLSTFTINILGLSQSLLGALFAILVYALPFFFTGQLLHTMHSEIRGANAHSQSRVVGSWIFWHILTLLLMLIDFWLLFITVIIWLVMPARIVYWLLHTPEDATRKRAI